MFVFISKLFLQIYKDPLSVHVLNNAKKVKKMVYRWAPSHSVPRTQPSTLLLLHTPHPLTPTLSLCWSALSLSGLVMRSEQCAGVLLWMLEWTGAGVKCWSSHRATSTLKTSPVTISRVQELEVIYTGLNNLAWILTLLHEVNFDNLF